MTLAEIRAAIERAENDRDQHLNELDNLRSRDDADTDGVVERIGRVNGMVRAADERIRDLEADYGRARADEVGRLEGRIDAGAVRMEGEPVAETRRSTPVDRSPAGLARSEALRAIESLDGLRPEAGDMLTELVRGDRLGLDARYLAAVSNPDYERAFALVLSDPTQAVFRMTDREAAAMRAVQEADSMRAMTSGGTTTGGYGVPATIDPTIQLSSDGDLNPLRKVATVTTINGSNQWKGVTSEGVAAHFRAEAAEVGDDSPTLAQPAITPERADAFVPYSIEAGQDYANLLGELGAAIADAKDVLEADKFLFGAGHGSNEPEGLIAGLDSGSLVSSAGASAFAADDVYNLQQAVPPRFSPRAVWLSSLTTVNKVRRMVDTDEPELLNEAGDRILGKPRYETPGVSGTIAPGEKVLVYGDLRAGFRIVDRIGLQLEVVQHLVGNSHRPTGQRGLFAYWRTSSGVTVDNAVRVLRIKGT